MDKAAMMPSKPTRMKLKLILEDGTEMEGSAFSAGFDRGGRRAAAMYSIIVTAKMHEAYTFPSFSFLRNRPDSIKLRAQADYGGSFSTSC